jgi:hypothetical protein
MHRSLTDKLYVLAIDGAAYGDHSSNDQCHDEFE